MESVTTEAAAKERVVRRQSGVAVFVTWNELFLLILRDDKPEISCPNVWCPPTGGIESGESHRDAARRELKEESRLDVENLHFLGTSPKGNAIYWAVVSSHAEAAEMAKGDEGQAVGWFPLCGLPPNLGGIGLWLRKYQSTFEDMTYAFDLPKIRQGLQLE